MKVVMVTTMSPQKRKEHFVNLVSKRKDILKYLANQRMSGIKVLVSFTVDDVLATMYMKAWENYFMPGASKSYVYKGEGSDLELMKQILHRTIIDLQRREMRDIKLVNFDSAIGNDDEATENWHNLFFITIEPLDELGIEELNEIVVTKLYKHVENKPKQKLVLDLLLEKLDQIAFEQAFERLDQRGHLNENLRFRL